MVIRGKSKDSFTQTESNGHKYVKQVCRVRGFNTKKEASGGKEQQTSIRLKHNCGTSSTKLRVGGREKSKILGKYLSVSSNEQNSS